MLDTADQDQEVMVALRNACVYAPAVSPLALDAAVAAVDEARKRLRSCLGRTPARRYIPPVVSHGTDAVDDGTGRQDVESASSQQTVELDLPSQILSTERATSSSSFATATTDPDGRSTVLSSTCSECGSFSSDDSRSPACTSGSESDF